MGKFKRFSRPFLLAIRLCTTMKDQFERFHKDKNEINYEYQHHCLQMNETHDWPEPLYIITCLENTVWYWLLNQMCKIRWTNLKWIKLYQFVYLVMFNPFLLGQFWIDFVYEFWSLLLSLVMRMSELRSIKWFLLFLFLDF